MNRTITINGFTFSCAKDIAEKIREGQAQMARMRQRLLANAQYEKYLSTFARNKVLTPFTDICRKITDDREYWRCLNLVYTGASAPNAIAFLLWAFEADRKHRDEFMSENDRFALAALPDVLTIYRGYQKGRGRMGLSWTLSKEVATWFAYRWPHRGPAVVASGTCHKHDVFAYCDERKEREIIINPLKVIGIRVLKEIGTTPFTR